MLIGNGRRKFTLYEAFFSNSKHFKPQTAKATQTTNIKMQSQPFFFHHNNKTHTQTLNILTSMQILYHPILKNPQLQQYPNRINTQKTDISIKPIQKIIAHNPLKLISKNNPVLENSETKEAL